MGVKKLKSLIRTKNEMGRKITSEASATFQIDSTIKFQHGASKIMKGKVLTHSVFGDKIKIKSETGKEYWISLFDILKLYE